jgi:hypothetical protein
MRSWKSGNIGYIVEIQALKWQHFWQHGGNTVATTGNNRQQPTCAEGYGGQARLCQRLRRGNSATFGQEQRLYRCRTKK